jgi:hypothetical protein
LTPQDCDAHALKEAFACPHSAEALASHCDAQDASLHPQMHAIMAWQVPPKSFDAQPSPRVDAATVEQLVCMQLVHVSLSCKTGQLPPPPLLASAPLLPQPLAKIKADTAQRPRMFAMGAALCTVHAGEHE